MISYVVTSTNRQQTTATISEEDLDETIADLSKEELEQFKELIEVLKEKLKENDGAMDVAIAY
jgi:predicted secreted protein